MVKKNKYCRSCGNPLTSRFEKISRFCKQCAREVRRGWDKLAEGKIKEGTKTIIEETTNKLGLQKGFLDKRIDKAIRQQEKKILRKAKKKGLGEEEAKQALEEFRNEL